MKTLKRFLHSLFIIPILWHPAAAQSLDPTFAPPSMRTPGILYDAAEQPDGKRILVGNFSRAAGVPAWGVSRFNANGTIDAAFQQNIGTAASANSVSLLANGQMFILTSAGNTTPLVVGGISRVAVARLNADGTGDPSFDMGTGPDFAGFPGSAFIDDVLPLPNGQAIVVGAFDLFNGAAINCIVRVTATGAIDPTFNAGVGAAPIDDIERIIPLPSGKFLACGSITSYNGVACGHVIRLNADGSLDPTFSCPITGIVDNLVLQPDGRILVSNNTTTNSGGTNGQGIGRILANGAIDNSFTPPAALTSNSVNSRYGDAMQLQPDGKIIITNRLELAGTTGIPKVARLNADGTLDTSFQAGTTPYNVPSSVLLLANGKILVVGPFATFGAAPERAAVLLNSDGTIDPSFQPIIQLVGLVSAVARQADGKLVVGGTFTEFNGQATRRLARFNADGTLDATFPLNPVNNASVVDLAIQPDGLILVATSSTVMRFTAAGVLDNTFSATSISTGSSLTRILLQSDGRLVVGGNAMVRSGTTIAPGFVRLMPDGSSDASFLPPSTGAGRFTGFQAMTQQADGKLLIAGRVAPTTATTTIRTVLRLESTGAVDASFTAGSFVGPGSVAATAVLNSLAVQSDGKILAGGNFSAYGSTSLSNVVRLNSDGTLDTGFQAATTTGTVNKLALQPNGRILLGGAFTSATLPTNLARLLPTGAADATFGATAVPNSAVTALLVQPDGMLVLGGSFASLSGQASMGIARITATNVLHVTAPQAVADRTEAWPIPAHTNLNISLDLTARPQSIDLLDVVGRPVLHQSLNGSVTAILPVETLAPGTYLLRVTYGAGTVVRRVQVQ